MRSILGDGGVLTASHSSFEDYTTDWTRTYRGGCAVLLPSSTPEVSALLKYCHSHDIKVTPQAGNTGLVGGSVPMSTNEVVLSLKRMNKILQVDECSMTVTAEAGVVLETLQNTMSDVHALTVPLDLGAKGSCMIGGNVATNAGGIRVLRYGSLHRNVLGVEVVMANGSVVDMTRALPKDNLGYHLKNLFIGSEGSLGVITKVVLQLYPRPASTNLMLLRLASFAGAVALKGIIYKKFSDILSAFEFLDDHCLNELKITNKNLFSKLNFRDTGNDNNGGSRGISGGIYVLIETSGFHGESDRTRLEDFVSAYMDSDGHGGEGGLGISDVIVAQDSKQISELWALRELVPTSLMQQSRSDKGKLYKYDVSLRIGDMDDLVCEIKHEISLNSVLNSFKYRSAFGIDDTRYEIFNFGHIGDGNLHLNVLVRPLPNLRIDSSRDECTAGNNTSVFSEDEKYQVIEMIHKEINTIIFNGIVKRNGSFSAEHGVGQQKLSYLLLTKSEQEIALMRSLKREFDPMNILNQGKVIDF